MCGICFISSLCSSAFEDGRSARNADSSNGVKFNNQTCGLDLGLLQHRGPDASSCTEFRLPGDRHAFMQGCVLHLRGKLTPQPITSSKGNALLWNGEIFGGLEVPDEENDTQVLFDILENLNSSPESVLETFQQIHGPWAFVFWQADSKTLWFGRDMFGRRSLLWHFPEDLSDDFVLSSVALSDKVYKEIPSVGIFRMDFSGLKSNPRADLPPLVVHPWRDCCWPGSSQRVSDTPRAELMDRLYPGSDQHCAVEVSASVDTTLGLHCWIPTMCTSLKRPEEASQGLPPLPESEMCRSDCKSSAPNLESERNGDDLKVDVSSLSSEEELERALRQIWVERDDLHPLVERCITSLQTAVNTRVKKITQAKRLRKKDAASDACQGQGSSARVAVLFSGGLDSTLLAALVDRCLPAEEPVDLLNVAFEQSAPLSQKEQPRKERKSQKHQQKARHQSRGRKEATGISCASVNTSSSQSADPTLASSEHPLVLQANHSAITPVCPLAEDLVGVRAHTADQPVSHLTDDLAASAISEVMLEKPPSTPDPLQVCVQGTVSREQSGMTSDLKSPSNVFVEATSFDPYNVPDRRTGRAALAELNPNRRWNFVEINVTQVELQSVRQSHIHRLISPLRTVLDDSIGCAVWFAARGQGLVGTATANEQKQTFSSQAQVLLCGMAADELFAGYSRHRVTFSKHGWSGLEREIQEELWRISARNLGRDDRIITDHGKEARFPYLDENFVQMLSEISLQKRVDFRHPRGLGEKLLLRLCALQLGLARTACQAKRAIQFGSKIAKLDNRKEKGSDICDRLS